MQSLFTRSRLRRYACLAGAAAINAVLLFLLTLTADSGGYGVERDEVITLLFLGAGVRPALAALPEVPIQKTRINRPRQPDLEAIDELRPEPHGPPTETAESVRTRMDESRRSRDTGSSPIPCGTVPSGTRASAQPIAKLMLRVGLDGRVTDAEIDLSSGDRRVDRALIQCAKSWGAFPIAIVDGRVQESWQRIDWPVNAGTEANQ